MNKIKLKTFLMNIFEYFVYIIFYSRRWTHTFKYKN